jgi:DNA/RNA-binding domain of Phe-tRNA-synthetase-like protein
VKVFEILISGQLRKVLPEVRLGCLNAVVRAEPSDSGLLMQIDETCDHLKNQYSIEEVSKADVVAYTKNAYRKLGKDPSRYRPSAEALTRRVVQGKGLYRVNNIVDALNMISIKHGFSIGGYDLDKIIGKIELGIGKPDEPYEAIGRGLLNIENLPVLRDQKGAFGSPTSDSMRTMVRDHTLNFLMVFFDFSGSGKLKDALNDAEYIYRKYCRVKEIETSIY